MADREQGDDGGYEGTLEGEESDTAITLGLLAAVERGDGLTQRGLAGELRIALGLVNAHLKRCARRGLIRVERRPPNRFVYHLTPQGAAEKARLTRAHLRDAFASYRQARGECAGCFERCLDRGQARIALAGIGELAEIAVVSQFGHDVELVGIFDPTVRPRRFAGLQVVPDPAGLPKHDAYLVTDLGDSQRTYDRLVARYGRERVHAPPMLRVNPDGAGAGTDLEGAT